jgi:rfaE bifunctional protein kinase chain/domain/rfaE bifunctional protein nucleotidyltransferase chain/domain
MSLRNKILDEAGLKKLKLVLKKKKIVLCHGVFDLLHIGHINYFHAAKKIGEVLVVSVTDDNYVNKGPGRPAFKIQNRIKFLKEINCIDYVCISKSPTAEKIIKSLKPNYYCKGPDYSGSQKINKDLNLKKEIKALNSVKGKFKTVNEEVFSSSKFINQNQLQNFNPECKRFIDLIRSKLNSKQILDNCYKIKNKKVLIIGETIIDNYITTEAIGKSGKEPVMVVKQKEQIKFLGGVGYIANLCSSFAKETKIISFLGEKSQEKNFVIKSLNKKIKHNFLLKKNSPTIVKTRYLDDYRKSKLLGVYDLNDNVISKKEEKKFINLLKNTINKYDIIVVADYGHGIITKEIRKIITKNSKKLFLNTQINSFNRGYHTVYNYKKINSLIINESELRYELKDKNSKVLDLAKKLRRKISVDNIIVTKGKWGSILINCKNWSHTLCPAFSENNIDTVGAGDTFFALSSLCIGSEVDSKLGLLISSLAASFSTNQIGNLFPFNYKILHKQLNHILK